MFSMEHPTCKLNEKLTANKQPVRNVDVSHRVTSDQKLEHQHLCEWIADKDVHHEGQDADWETDLQDIASVVDVLHAVHQTSVWGKRRGVSMATNTMRMTPVATGIGSMPSWLEKFSTTGMSTTAIAALFAKLVRIRAMVNMMATRYHFTATAEGQGQAADEEVRHTGSLVGRVLAA